MGKREVVIGKKLAEIEALKRDLTQADFYRDEAQKSFDEAKRNLNNWSQRYDEVTSKIEELETEVELLEEVVFAQPTPTVGTWADHTGITEWQASN